MQYCPYIWILIHLEQPLEVLHANVLNDVYQILYDGGGVLEVGSRTVEANIKVLHHILENLNF